MCEYLQSNIKDVSKIKMDNEKIKKESKEFSKKQELMLNNMVTFNDTTVKICTSYTDNKQSEFQRLLIFLNYHFYIFQ